MTVGMYRELKVGSTILRLEELFLKVRSLVLQQQQANLRHTTGNTELQRTSPGVYPGVEPLPFLYAWAYHALSFTNPPT